LPLIETRLMIELLPLNEMRPRIELGLLIVAFRLANLSIEMRSLAVVFLLAERSLLIEARSVIVVLLLIEASIQSDVSAADEAAVSIRLRAPLTIATDSPPPLQTPIALHVESVLLETVEESIVDRAVSNKLSISGSAP
jgi:hypothetical protein